MAKQDDDKDDGYVMTPVGRVINHSLFVKDLFDDGKKKADKAYYKLELAFEPEDVQELEDAMLDFAVEKWGEGADEDDDLYLPLMDGDKLAKKRERKDKDGDAYKGKIVLRMKTEFNKEGENDGGGVSVFDEDTEPVTAMNKGDIYPGCYGQAAIAFAGYDKDTDDGDQVNAITVYLVAFQKHRDGDKLVQSSDKSQLFKKVGKKDKKEGGRKRRKS